MKKTTLFSEKAPKMLKKAFFILCALAALMIFSCGGDDGPSGPYYNMVGTYTYPWNSEECTLVFFPDGTYEVTGGNHDIIGASIGTWSVKGDEITIITKEHPEYPDVFIVQENGNQVTLTLKDRPSSFFIGTHLLLSGTSVTLTKLGTSTDFPINKSVNIQLTYENWVALLDEIKAGGRSVNLDLSKCTRSNDEYGAVLTSTGAFNPGGSGSDKIVSMILPDAADSIDQFPSGFKNLTSVTFKASLSWNYTSGQPFMNTPISSFILTGNGPLSTIENGKALVRNNTELISYPTASGNITLNNITRIGDSAFRGGYTNLTSIRLPDVTSIGVYAFIDTGAQPLTIYLGSTAPTLGMWTNSNSPGGAEIIDTSGWDFNGDRITRTVTVKVPSGAQGYGTIPATYSGTDVTRNWGNGFRGMGWDGNTTALATINFADFFGYPTYYYVTLKVEYE